MKPQPSADQIPAGLMLVHGNQAESLRDLVVAWIKRYPLAPLESEVVLVQSNGVAQWLKLALAADDGGPRRGGCGIAAGLEFSLPSRFLWQVYRAQLGAEAVAETSPFDKPRLVWRLMRLLPKLRDDARYAPLIRFLQDDDDLRKRFQLAERLADLYDQYQVYRADWLAAWAAGHEVLIDAGGERSTLSDEDRWQAALWCELLADVADAEPTEGALSQAGRAAVHERFMARARAWTSPERPAGVPRRVVVFGIASLPRQWLEVLAVLGRWTQVLMCVHNPCEHYWADIVAGQDLLRAQASRQRRRVGLPPRTAEAVVHGHPLLAAWGRQGRDFVALLDEHDHDESRAGYAGLFEAIGSPIDVFEQPACTRLLGQLQDDIRELRPLPESRAKWAGNPVDPARDDSIRFHVAHGPQREVEILHDQLLAAFDADPTLSPRDVIVMVPNIDAYAPHIRAVFGLIDKTDARFIPFSVADQGRRGADPLVLAVESLLALPQSRVAASDVLDLLEVPALRARFGIAEDELPVLRRWIRGANIRWGLHDEHRKSLGLPPAERQAAQNSWLFGLRRMLLGYAVGSQAPAWRGIEPHGEIGGLEAALLGALAGMVERLEASWRALREPATVSEWCERLRRLMADFFAADGEDGDTLEQLEAALQRWQEASEDAGFDEALPLSVAGEQWLASIDDTGLGQRFFGGAVTFASLMSMRAIPFRVVCLLGMNDGDYPLARSPMDFDLMSRDCRPGDRSRREDDRYLFLEALLSARERLHVSWVGRSSNDNTSRPPSVLVGQLRDHLAAGWRLKARAGSPEGYGEALLAALTVEHRLQPFSADYFPARPDAARLFTYAREWACAVSSPDPAADTPLPQLAHEEPLALGELADFMRDPVRAFFHQRLQVRFETEDPVGDDAEPFVLDGLRRWVLQNELIQAQARAMAEGGNIAEARAACLAAIVRRGELAAGNFGAAMAEKLVEPMAALFADYARALARWPVLGAGDEEIRFEASIDDRTLLVSDRLSDIRMNADGDRGRVVLDAGELVRDGKCRGDKLIRHWVAHLAVHAGGDPLSTEIIGKVGRVRLQPIGSDEADAHLTKLLSAWSAGMRRPLPLALRTALAWLGALPDRDRALGEARRAYEGGYGSAGELGESAYLQRGWPSFQALHAGGEFAELATTLLRPMLDAAEVDTSEGSSPGAAT